jgi:guanine deaminase
MLDQIVRGPLLIPQDNGSLFFHKDGALAATADGTLQFAGDFNQLQKSMSDVVQITYSNPAQAENMLGGVPVRRTDGMMIPPLLDIHIHIPQHPIRGRFCEGVPDDAPQGKLLAGLQRNVFPTEAQCHNTDHAEHVVRRFLADTLSHGVVGGAAYMTPSVTATEVALSILPESWRVGLVLMNQNCPENLRTDETNLEKDVERLAKKFGRRLIITDRFAVAVGSPLRRQACELAKRFGLRTQTHLNEQLAEKDFVERVLYPRSASYTDVYLKDGLLDHQCIVAHCIQMTDDEWSILRDTGAVIAHCPTSNLLLGSGVMSLDEVLNRKIRFAIATDVGASPTVSMIAEMSRFVQVHANRSDRATFAEALFRATRAPADILGLTSQFGRLEAGQPMSFIEAETLLPDDIDNPSQSVLRITIAGKTIFQRSHAHA